MADTPAAAVEQPAEALPAGAGAATAPKAEPSPKEPATPDPNVIAPVEPTPMKGELVITSTPPGATVLVNGINRGRTPVRMQSLPAGSYTVRFILSGHHSVTQRATISPQRPSAQVSAELAPVEAAPVEAAPPPLVDGQ
jgi:hypothetical protein